MPTRPTNEMLAANGGEMALRTRALDWQQTPLGDAELWPEPLKAIVKMILHAKFPMFVIWGPEYVCFYNDGYIPMLGARHPSSLGLPFKQVWPEIWDEIYPLIVRAYAGDATLNINVPLRMLRNGDPEKAYFSFSYSPIFDDHGGIAGMLCVCMETTEQIEAEQNHQKAVEELAALAASLECRVATRTAELEQLHEQLRQSQKLEAIGNLTGGVAHDFNNTLQVISGNLQLMRQATRNDPALHGRLNAAMAGVERGAKLASQLLSFARRQPLEPIVINAGRLITNVDEMLRRAVGETVKVETIISGGLWNTLADRNQLENALLNLVLNARDAMNGHGRITIETSNASLDDAYANSHGDVQQGQYVLIAVSDTGCGMDARTIDRVFEPFFTTKPEGQGTGLGLPMVYGFVKQSGGHIKLYSEVGHGTTVKIYLPRTLEDEISLPSYTSGPVVGGDETILVAEDDPQVRDTVVALLTDLGYRVYKANDATSALAVLESGVPIDLLFTDVVMPGTLRSPELARRAAALQPGIEVLFTSGYTENGIVHHGRLDPGVSLISKPYRREDLARKIRHSLANRAQRIGVKNNEPPIAAGPVGKGLPSMTILLVEDDPLISQISADILSSLGQKVISAPNAEKAIETLKNFSFDILVTDVTLPHMSGILLAKLAMQDYDVQVIFASGHTREADAPAEALWLQKPFGFDQMLETLEEAIQRRMGKIVPKVSS